MTSALKYSYKDTDGDVFGPFSGIQMTLLYRKGRLPMTSKIIVHNGKGENVTVELSWLIEDNGADEPFPETVTTQLSGNIRGDSKKKSDHPVVYYYWDSSFNKKGPFKAKDMLYLYLMCQLNAESKIHLTANSVSQNDGVNCQLNLEKLISIFGPQNPFPSFREECKLKLPGCNNANRRSSSDEKSISQSSRSLLPSIMSMNISEPAAKPVIRSEPQKSNSGSAIAVKQYLPFFGGVNNVPKNIPAQVIPLEMVIDLCCGLFVRYGKLRKDERKTLGSKLESLGLPSECKICDKKIKSTSDYLPHVLSNSHLTKTMEKGIRYSNEHDYIKTRDMIVSSVSVQNSETKASPSPVPTSNNNSIMFNSGIVEMSNAKKRSGRHRRGNNENKARSSKV